MWMLLFVILWKVVHLAEHDQTAKYWSILSYCIQQYIPTVVSSSRQIYNEKKYVDTTCFWPRLSLFLQTEVCLQNNLNLLQSQKNCTHSNLKIMYCSIYHAESLPPCCSLVSLVSPALAQASVTWKLNQCKSEPLTVYSSHWSWAVAASPPLILTLKSALSFPPIMASPGTLSKR